MTLEEKADKYASGMYFPTDAERIAVVEAYIAGAKESNVVWHDLRKDPKDLPQKTSMVLSQSGDKVKYHIYGGKGHWLSQEAADLSKYVIAWCEIPRL